MDNLEAALDGVYLGKLSHIGPGESPTGFFKSLVEERVAVSMLGIQGDMQADRRVHGGPEKAVYHFPAENYTLLQAALPHLHHEFIPGSIGENLSSTGMNDEQVHIGDIYRIGSVLVQVSQPRRPCWKVNHRYGNRHIGALLMAEGISGWYYRILEEGELGIGDPVALQERLPNSIPVKQIWQMFLERLEKGVAPETLLPTVPGLSNEWRFQ